MAARNFSSVAQRTTLTASCTNVATTMVVGATTGFPASTPFTLIVDPDTVNEEIVEVTNRAGTTLTVTRGVDGSAGVAHSSGAVVFHGITARDLQEPNTHIAASTGVHGRTSALASVSDTETFANKSISGATNTLTAVPQSAVTNLTADLAAKAALASPTFTGTVTLPADTVLNGVSLASGVIAQVVQATYSTDTGSTSATFADTGLSATITPKKSTSKILVTVSIPWMVTHSSGASAGAAFQLLRGATAVLTLPSNAIFTQSNSTAGIVMNGVLHIDYLDSPATGAAVTYKVQHRLTGGTGMSSQPSSATAVMTLMEVTA